MPPKRPLGKRSRINATNHGPEAIRISLAHVCQQALAELTNAAVDEFRRAEAVLVIQHHDLTRIVF
jgi:hypothetical protein